MKKLIVLFVSILVLVSLSCPIFASAAYVDVQLPDSTGLEKHFQYTVGTSGGGKSFMWDYQAIVMYFLYMASPENDNYPSFIDTASLAGDVSYQLKEGKGYKYVYQWCCAAGNDILSENIVVPPIVIETINECLANNEYQTVSWRVPSVYALPVLTNYFPLNYVKARGSYFLTKGQYDSLDNTEHVEEMSLWQIIKSKVIDMVEYTKNGFRDLDGNFLTSFSTLGNQLYSIRDKITFGTKPLTDYITELKDKFGEGVQDIIDNSWIGETFQPDNFEDESFNQYDDFLDELEDDRLALLDKIDSFEFGFHQAIQEISSALIFVSMVFGVFAQIPFLQTVFNVSLALGMTATVLGLVPMVVDRLSRSKGGHK